VSAASSPEGSPPVRAEGGAIRTLTLNRNDQLNAIDEDLQRAIVAALRASAEDAEVRVIVLTGSGRAFSAGGDIDTIDAMRQNVDLRRRVLDQGRELFEVFRAMPVPVIAAVNGPAVGAGCTLALSCDIVVMAENAYFADPHVTVGLVPGDGGAVLWPLLAGLASARAYLLTGDRMSASEAHRLGLIYKIAPQSDVIELAIDLAQRIASLPAFAVRETKRGLNLHVARAAERVLEHSLRAEFESFDQP
jgi:enoyl-CoA hydratase